jgi:hypothetical protein
VRVRSLFDNGRHAPGASSRRWVLTPALALLAILVLTANVRAGILDASWTEPATNVNGTRLTDLAAYRVYYSLAGAECSGSPFDEIPALNARPAIGSTMSHRLTGLSTGSPYFVSITAVDAGGNESDCVTAAHSAVARIDFSVDRAGKTGFGKVQLSETADRIFIVTNTGGGTVTGTVTTAAPFRVVSGSSFALTGAGDTHAVRVRFSPTIVATANGSVIVRSNGGRVSRLVAGTGIAPDSTAPAVAIISPTTSSTLRTSAVSRTLSGTAADDAGVTSVSWSNSAGGEGIASGTTAWKAADIPLAMGTNVITVTARDAAGNTATDQLTVTRVDRTPPVVSFTGPAPGSTLSGAVTLSASATDNVGVVGVQFKLDGVDLGPQVTTTPYAMVWQTGTAAPGSHTLTVVARDAAGNRTISLPVAVTVRSVPE